MGRTAKVQQTNKGQYVITIPRALAQAMHLERGQKVEWEVAGAGKLLLKAAVHK